MYTSLTGDEDEAVDNYHVSMLMLAPRRQQVNDTVRLLCGFKCPANRKLLLKIISRRCAHLITVLSFCVYTAPLTHCRRDVGVVHKSVHCLHNIQVCVGGGGGRG